MTNYLKADLENKIDTYSLSHIIDTLSVICLDKAEHLRVNWQDEFTANQWERMARKLNKLPKNI